VKNKYGDFSKGVGVFVRRMGGLLRIMLSCRRGGYSGERRVANGKSNKKMRISHTSVHHCLAPMSVFFP
jgi:hypothetical protein